MGCRRNLAHDTQGWSDLRFPLAQHLHMYLECASLQQLFHLLRSLLLRAWLLFPPHLLF